MAAGDLAALADVKAWGAISGTTDDTALGRLISAASAWVASYTHRSFFQASFSEIRSGSGGQKLLVANAPLISVTSLAVDALPIPAQPADGQPGYFLAGGAVIGLYGYTFNRGQLNVRVTYSAGFATVPLDVAQACIEMVVSAYRRGQRGPDLSMKGNHVSGENMTWSLKDIPASAKSILDDYVKVIPL